MIGLKYGFDVIILNQPIECVGVISLGVLRSCQKVAYSYPNVCQSSFSILDYDSSIEAWLWGQSCSHDVMIN